MYDYLKFYNRRADNILGHLNTALIHLFEYWVGGSDKQMISEHLARVFINLMFG